VRIADVDVFDIEIPMSSDELEVGKLNRYTVVRVDTDAGVSGISFAGRTHVDFSGQPLASQLEAIRSTLCGEDLFAVDQHLRRGLLGWGAIEHALWDAIGRLAGQPVYRLLGGTREGIRAYVTCARKGSLASAASAEEHAEIALRVRDAGFRGMKIRAWHANPFDVVEASAAIRDAVGDDLAIMVDRTAHWSGSVWSFDTALTVAQGLERFRVAWLEEPFGYDDFELSARLAREVDIPIAGGEGYRGLEPFRQAIQHGSLAILQPDAVIAGGILTVVKVAALAEAFGLHCIVHGAEGLSIAGWLQASAAIGANWQEIVVVGPPFVQEQWSPGIKVLKSGSPLLTIRNGEVQLPTGPGLGLDVDEAALIEYRVI
jgi:D-galactarolactone cycloisomerase